jgi:putative ABC transport system ATP-binding protein
MFGMSVIRTVDVSKIYSGGNQSVVALNQVNLTFEQGEFTCVIGPSGSGKTTLLNIIGGLDKPTQGEVYIADKRIDLMGSYDRIDFRLHNIGFVFQYFNLIPVMTAFENAAFIMQLQGYKEEEVKERIEFLLSAVGLEKRMHAKPAEMSGGEQQRVAVVRALASRPKFILADEPTANLDSKSAFNLLDIMQKLNHEEGITFIFSTHDQRVIDKARRVIKMVDGAVVEDRMV